MVRRTRRSRRPDRRVHADRPAPRRHHDGHDAADGRSRSGSSARSSTPSRRATTTSSCAAHGRISRPRSGRRSRPAGRCSPPPASIVEDYRDLAQDAIGPGAQVVRRRGLVRRASFLLFLSVISLLGIVLIVMSLGGVFDTVLLEMRQRTREMAVLKALGLAPRQVVVMVIASVVPGGSPGRRHRRARWASWPSALVLGYMGQVAAGTRDPESRRSTCSRSWSWSASASSGLGDRAARRVPAGPARGPRADRAGPAGGVMRPEQRPSGIEIA